MTTLITIARLAEATGLSYRLCLQLVGSRQIPSVAVGPRRRIDVRWVEQWLASGGYCADRAAARMELNENIRSSRRR